MAKERSTKSRWKVVLIVGVIIVMLGVIGACSNAGNNSTSSSSPSSQSGNAATTTESLDAEQFIADVQSAIQGDISTAEGESITDVQLNQRTLLIDVDISSTHVPDNFLIEDVAANRASAITDDILSLTQYDELWDTVTVDFGDVGHITRSQSEANGSGTGRYYDLDYTSVVK